MLTLSYINLECVSAITQSPGLLEVLQGVEKGAHSIHSSFHHRLSTAK